MRLVWLTDLHLNFVAEAERDRLIEQVLAANPDHLLIGGDIAEAGSFAAELEWIADEAGCPVSFVLGNHDYYRGSIWGVRHQAEQQSCERADLTWLPAAGVVALNDQAALIGHGGWGDARAGDFLASDVVLNDYRLIEELRSAEFDVVEASGGRPVLESILTV